MIFDAEGYHVYIIGIVKDDDNIRNEREAYRAIPENAITQDQLKTLKKIHEESPFLYSSDVDNRYSSEYVEYLIDGGIPEGEIDKIVQNSYVFDTHKKEDIQDRETLEQSVEGLAEQQQNVIKQYARGGVIYNALKKHYGEVRHVIDEFGNGWWEVTRPPQDTIVPKGTIPKSICK